MYLRLKTQLVSSHLIYNIVIAIATRSVKPKNIPCMPTRACEIREHSRTASVIVKTDIDAKCASSCVRSTSTERQTANARGLSFDAYVRPQLSESGEDPNNSPADLSKTLRGAALFLVAEHTHEVDNWLSGVRSFFCQIAGRPFTHNN